MIEQILDLLKDTNCKSEIVQLAEGKKRIITWKRRLRQRQKQDKEWKR